MARFWVAHGKVLGMARTLRIEGQMFRENAPLGCLLLVGGALLMSDLRPPVVPAVPGGHGRERGPAALRAYGGGIGIGIGIC